MTRSQEPASTPIADGGWKYNHDNAQDREDFRGLTAVELTAREEDHSYDFSDHPAKQVELLLADARSLLGGISPAELDIQLQGGIDWAEGASMLSASGALRWAVEDLAAAKAGLPATPEHQSGWEALGRRRAEAAEDLLSGGLRAELDAYAAGCREKRFVGWSRWSTGPVRYADDPAPPAGPRPPHVGEITGEYLDDPIDY